MSGSCPCRSWFRGLDPAAGLFVFLNDVAGQPAAVGYGDALLLGPGAHLPGACPVRGCSRPAARRPPPARQPGMLHKRSETAAEIGGVPGIQV
jgi:hypothetical protein